MRWPSGAVRRVVVTTAVLLVLSSPPALADPVGPSHYESEVVEVDANPAVSERFTVSILGDTYLVLRLVPGAAAEVPGYDGEPYLRFAADGRVEVNDRSPARWLNDERYGAIDVDLPAVADPDAPPQWRQVADDGVYAWHDHRIHFMSPSLPRHVDPSSPGPQPVFDWEVPLVVDGHDVVVHGRLTWLAGPGPVWPGAAVVAVAVASWAAWRRRLPVVVVTCTGALVAALVGAGMVLGLPEGADRHIALLALPGLTVGLAVLAGWADRRRASGTADGSTATTDGRTGLARRAGSSCPPPECPWWYGRRCWPVH